MQFSDFSRKLKGVIGGKSSAATFTKTLFETILVEDETFAEEESILSEYSKDTFKAYFSGNTGISGIAKKISPYLDHTLFSEYIYSFPDKTIDVLCVAFKDELPDCNPHNIGELLSDLFVSIIAEAATKKKRTPKGANTAHNKLLGVITDIAPELTEENAGNMFFISPELTKGLLSADEEKLPFQAYLNSACAFYSTKKTLLYAEKPHPFYDLYVCNDIKYRKFRITGARDPKPNKVISNATVQKLEAESKNIIIEGIGGIGKSMLLTHLFLSSATEYEDSERIPVFLSLKDYKENTVSILDFIYSALKVFDETIKKQSVIKALQQKQFILLLDGLDEIQTGARDAFETDIEAFIKSYPGNMIVTTSRPINAFISYSKFSVFEIEPLSKKQALDLVEKLDFWDVTAKKNFISALDASLYYSHVQFASNPLLLTIMLMTYSTFGEVPAKMHVFYSKAYETMARLHDASKGSFKRPLHTKLTPEEFAKYFAQFCARTYADEILEFDEMSFSSYMKKALKGSYAEQQGVSAHDFLLDLTDNLCIMYREGNKYFFIHRSFQEYFAAVYFASEYDAKLYNVGMFFEKRQHRSYTDRTFDMLHDMIPEKVERFIFFPFLEKLLTDCAKAKNSDYWDFLERQYPALYYDEGNTGESYLNEAQSFLYKTIVKSKQLGSMTDIDDVAWPKQVSNLPAREWVYANQVFLEYEAYEKYPDPDAIPEELLEDCQLIFRDELPSQYSDYFGEPETEGLTIEIEIYDLRKNPSNYAELCSFMESSSFPLMEEYENIKAYYLQLKTDADKEKDSEDLFED